MVGVRRGGERGGWKEEGRRGRKMPTCILKRSKHALKLFSSVLNVRIRGTDIVSGKVVPQNMRVMKVCQHEGNEGVSTRGCGNEGVSTRGCVNMRVMRVCQHEGNEGVST